MCLSIFAKHRAFFGIPLGLLFSRDDAATRVRAGDELSVQLVPDDRADKTKDVSDHSGNHDQSAGCKRIKWSHHVNRLNHVRPENKIDDRLRPAN